MNRIDGESETFIANALTANGFDASEDGTGRGTPIVPVAVEPYTLAIRGRGDDCNLEYRQDGTANALMTPNGGRGGIGVGAVAFHENQRHELTLNDTAGSLKVGGGKPGQGYPAVMTPYLPQGYRIQNPEGPSETISCNPAGGMRVSPVLAPSMSVRRLTPKECARLQGFPDDYCQIPYRGKPAADGPQYKAYGNSMAVPVLRWILTRILASEAQQ